MGNTQAKSQQYSNLYVDKTTYNQFLSNQFTPIIDKHTGLIDGLRNDLTGEIANRVALSQSFDAFQKQNSKDILAITDKDTGAIAIAVKLSSDKLMKAVGDATNQITAYITTNDARVSDISTNFGQYRQSNDAAILALKNDLTGQIAAAGTLSQTAIQQINSTLDQNNVVINKSISDLDSKFTSQMSTINTTLSSLQQQFNTFKSVDLPYNTTFQQLGIGNGWFLQPQQVNGQDNLCIGKGTQILTCLDTAGNLNYDPANANIQRQQLQPALAPTARIDTRNYY